ncbi:MAG: DUF1844 domain-containing protein [Syntrophales bacterium]|nr:DUF1844 domain-containing protein [Syntrophales bacterium]
MEDDQKEKGFVIKDRRLFDETGEARRTEEAKEVKEEKPAVDEEKVQKPSEDDDHEINHEAYLPEVNFSNFVLSLSTTVMYHFGDFPDPVTNKSVRNLRAAKHTIDTIGMLKTKTSGNLDDNETDLLDGLLFELRMRFVKESNPK